MISEFFYGISITEWQNYATDAYRLGDHYERTYHGCGQCLIAAVFDALGVHHESVFQSATGLAEGLGLVGKSTCAVLIGSVMIFGLVFQRKRENFNNDRENKYRTYKMAQNIYQKYIDHFGSVICHDIHEQILGRPFDLREPDERSAFEAAGAHENKCTKVIALAARWTVQILGDELQVVQK